MLRGRDIIVFSDDWGRHPFSCQHIMSRFLPDNRLLWVNTLGMRNPGLTLYDLRRSVEKVRSWFTSSQAQFVHHVENLTIIRPVVTPYNNVALLRMRNRQSVIRTVRTAMDALGMNSPIVVTTLPNSVDYLGEFDETLSVYYCVDDFTHWPGLNHAFVAQMEELLLSKVDLVCASAEELCRIKARNGSKPLLLPHGVDYEHFAAVTHEPGKMFPGIPRPIIGFFGAISPWLDLEMLHILIKGHPEWSFVFIGPVDAEISQLRQQPNFILPGKVPYQQLPAYAASFDVALIPFLVNELTVSVNPLKLMEYLACGLPVVSTRLPEVAKQGDLVCLADTAEEFAKAISTVLADDSDTQRRLRREVAQRSSWDAVADKFSHEIERTYSQKVALNTIGGVR